MAASWLVMALVFRSNFLAEIWVPKWRKKAEIQIPGFQQGLKSRSLDFNPFLEAEIQIPGFQSFLGFWKF
jgi:hypothetical protein